MSNGAREGRLVTSAGDEIWFLEQVQANQARLRAFIRGQGVRSEAVDDLDAFVAAEPSRVDGRLWRSRARAALGRFEDAERDLDEAVHLDPGDARPWAERGIPTARGS